MNNLDVSKKIINVSKKLIDLGKKVKISFVEDRPGHDTRYALNSNKIKKNLIIKDASMATADDVKKITGFTIGGVSPIGHLNKIPIIIDNSLERFENLYAAAGHPNCVFKIDFTNLQKITEGLIKEITE